MVAAGIPAYILQRHLQLCGEMRIDSISGLWTFRRDRDYWAGARCMQNKNNLRRIFANNKEKCNSN